MGQRLRLVRESAPESVVEEFPVRQVGPEEQCPCFSRAGAHVLAADVNGAAKDLVHRKHAQLVEIISESRHSLFNDVFSVHFTA
jgi:hypothetical protein